jgi:UDP-N-acetylglucosamine 2-epimerase (non-hydrolysing)/GDP/UDP-N,N'-diacetylbacillosamine 2-epimerase (hydrolysing)
MHLSPEFGLTVKQIEADGFPIGGRVEMLLSADTPVAIAKSVGIGVIGMADALANLRPDVVLVLGDRFEILAAAQACLFLRIPLAHVAGGDTSEGAFDESIRHAITKMAHLHFVTNELSKARVLQLGEDPRSVFVVGSPGLDHLRRQELLARSELEAELGARLGSRNVLFTFHPETLDTGSSDEHLGHIIEAMDTIEGESTIWCTQPNADTGGRAIFRLLEAWKNRSRGRVHLYDSLGQRRYLSLMSFVDVVAGNSSSGLYEAPSLAVPTVNIGTRQRGRLAASSVIHCATTVKAVSDALIAARGMDCSGVVNPYGDGMSAGRIVRALERFSFGQDLLMKRFFMRTSANV